MSNEPFKAATAKVVITPPLGTLINGDFISHYACRVHDELYAKALVLCNGQQTLAIVVVDICAMQKDFIDEVKSLIGNQTGLPAENIMLSATHSHATGSVTSLLLGAADHAYRQKLPGLIARSVSLACQELRPARLAFGAVKAPEHLRCRRYHMEAGYEAFNPVTDQPERVKTNPFGGETAILEPVAPVDPELAYMALQSTDGQWLGLLANYSLHYVGDWENGMLSADYFGCFAEEVQRLLAAGTGFNAIMSNGTSGDVNIWDFKDQERYPAGTLQKSRLIGRELAERVVASLNGLHWDTSPCLAAAFELVPVPRRETTPEAIERAKSILANANLESICEIDQENLRQIYARECLLLQEYQAVTSFPIQAFRIGQGMIGALGGEFFSETGLWLKSRSPFKRYFTITMANGYTGYVPPAQELALGGYETWLCRSSYLAAPSEALIRQRLHKLLQNL